MPRFAYTAQNEKGQSVEGQVEADGEMDAIAQVQRQGLLVLNIHEDRRAAYIAASNKQGGKNAPASAVAGLPQAATSPGIKKFLPFDFFAAKAPPAADMIFLAEQLALLLKGGVPLLRGLKILAQNVGHAGLKKTLNKVSDDVAGGRSFYEALARHPEVFGDIWLSMVQAGEASGRLPETLTEVSNYLNQRDVLKARVITAFMYPAILIALSIFILIYFVVKVVPVFAGIFAGFNMKLPALTQFVIDVSSAVTRNFALMAGVSIFGFVCASAYLKTEAGQWAKARLLLALPYFGVFISNLYIEMFLSNFSLLLKSSVDVIKSLQIVAKILSGNKVYAHAALTAAAAIKQGATVSQGFAKAAVFPDLPKQMMAMGEESGSLPDVMQTLAQFYRRQIDTFITRLSSVIDPIMVVFIGGIVGVIVMAMFMPIFELSSVGSRH